MIFTNTPASRALAHCVMPLAPVYRGGDSEANTTNKTEVRDMRVVGGNDSSNVSANTGDNSNVTVIATDHGAVSGGLQLGHDAIDAVVQNAQGLQQTTASMYAGALSTIDTAGARMADAFKTSGAQVADAWSSAGSQEASITKNAMSAVADAYQSSGSQLADAYSSVASNLATAFTDSKAPDKSLLQVAGVIVVGLAAVMVFAKR